MRTLIYVLIYICYKKRHHLLKIMDTRIVITGLCDDQRNQVSLRAAC